MKRQIARYFDKLLADGSAKPEHMAVLAKDDVLLETGSAELLPIGRAVLERLNVVISQTIRQISSSDSARLAPRKAISGSWKSGSISNTNRAALRQDDVAMQAKR